MQPMVVDRDKDFAFRLDQALTNAGFPEGRERRRSVSRAFRVSVESVRKWLTGEALPQTERLVEIAKACGVRFEWLVSGRGPMAGEDSEGGAAYGTVQSSPLQANEPPSPAPEIQGDVPLISWIQAGEWHEAADPYAIGDAEDWYPCLRRHGPRTYALRVVGLSMWNPYGRPSYDEGDIIFVDPDQAGGVVNGDRVIALLNSSSDHEVTFKQLVSEGGHHFLKALNPQYPPITDGFEIIGKVIGAWRD